MHVYTWRRSCWQQRNGGCSQGCRKAFLIASCDAVANRSSTSAAAFPTLCARLFHLSLGFLLSRERAYSFGVSRSPLSRGCSRDQERERERERWTRSADREFLQSGCLTIGRRMRLRLQGGYNFAVSLQMRVGLPWRRNFRILFLYLPFYSFLGFVGQFGKGGRYIYIFYIFIRIAWHVAVYNYTNGNLLQMMVKYLFVGTTFSLCCLNIDWIYCMYHFFGGIFETTVACVKYYINTYIPTIYIE